MEEIRKRDTRIFIREAFRPGRIFIFVIMALILAMVMGVSQRIEAVQFFGLIFCGITGVTLYKAFQDSIGKRFYDHRFQELWNACQDRVKRNKTALDSLREGKIADMRELPSTVERLSEELYVALRKADIVMHEAVQSEAELKHVRPYTLPAFPDKHAQELLQVADRNIAEYNINMSKVLSGVQRTEAQAVVFVTTLDTLRARMLSHMSVGRTGNIENAEFLTVIKEARQQLDAIDKALEEIDAPLTKSEYAAAEADLRSHLSRTSPPPVPEHLIKHVVEKTDDRQGD